VVNTIQTYNQQLKIEKNKKTSCGAKAHQTPPHVAHRGIARFLGIDQKLNQVVP